MCGGKPVIACQPHVRTARTDPARMGRRMERLPNGPEASIAGIQPRLLPNKVDPSVEGSGRRLVAAETPPRRSSPDLVESIGLRPIDAGARRAQQLEQWLPQHRAQRHEGLELERGAMAGARGAIGRRRGTCSRDDPGPRPTRCVFVRTPSAPPCSAAAFFGSLGP